MPPATLLTGVGEHLAQGFPDPQRAVADREHRRGHPAAAATPQQISPRLGGFPIAVGQRDQLFAAIRANPDHHQQAEFLLLEAHLQMDAVDPQVHEIGAREVAVGKCSRLVLPPGD